MDVQRADWAEEALLGIADGQEFTGVAGRGTGEAGRAVLVGKAEDLPRLRTGRSQPSVDVGGQTCSRAGRAWPKWSAGLR